MSWRRRIVERRDVWLASGFKAAGILALGAIGLLIGACSTVMLVTDYKATVLYNDTDALRAECQMADSLKPEIDWIGPGEAMLAHSGRYCAVHAQDGQYYGCIREDLISEANGGTVYVSQVDPSISASQCLGVRISRPFNPEAFKPRKGWPSKEAQRGTGFVVMGYVVAAGFVLGSVMLVLKNRSRKAT